MRSAAQVLKTCVGQPLAWKDTLIKVSIYQSERALEVSEKVSNNVYHLRCGRWARYADKLSRSTML